MPPAAIFLSTAKEIWKRTPPKTNGFWNSFTPNVIRRKKAHKESLPLLSPLPLPRTARVACYCRFHVPRGSALLRRSRRSRRLVARSFHASGRDISRSGATSFCPRRQKDAKTPPKTHGLWNSFTPNVIRRKKAHKESPPRLSPLPLPRTARVACHDRLRDSAIRAAAASMFRAAVRWLIGGVSACRSTKYASQQRVFFIFRGPTGRTCTCRQRRHVRDLVIAKIGRTTRPHFALQER